MKRKCCPCIIVIVLSICCSTIRYSPADTNTNQTEAKEIVKQVVQEQPDELAPIKVEVTDRYFKMYGTKTNAVDGYTIPWNTVVYFKNIGEIKLRRKKKWSKKWFVISIMDKNNKEKYTVYTAYEIKAKSFIDALITLRKIPDESATEQTIH